MYKQIQNMVQVWKACWLISSMLLFSIRQIDFHIVFWSIVRQEPRTIEMLFYDCLERKLSRKKVRKQTTDRQKKGRGGKKRKTSIVLLENDMLCSSSVISHGVEWTAGLLAWLTFWHPQRQRSLSGTSQETAGLYELVTSFVLFLLHGRWNPHQIRQRCRKRKQEHQLEWIVNS